MIRGLPGSVFSTAADGDLRSDPEARRMFASSAAIPPEWATVHQVHGSTVVRVEGPGTAGDADALFTTRPGVPVAIFTADCYPVVLSSARAVGIAHAGWRGLAAGVIDALRSAMGSAGVAPTHASIGPGIGPCCFEVGDDVLSVFPGHTAETTWNTPSVDLLAVVRDGLAGLDVWEAGVCTRCGSGFHSHRRDGTDARMAGVAWL
jgi:YfiH family protein